MGGRAELGPAGPPLGWIQGPRFDKKGLEFVGNSWPWMLLYHSARSCGKRSGRFADSNLTLTAVSRSPLRSGDFSDALHAYASNVVTSHWHCSRLGKGGEGDGPCSTRHPRRA
ncbi:hypothetical protein F4814DRAFT_325478 [Daldinia grandis]|nr:hypothetical protein F4814DRAFT_325478 [Daldinia grandis]